MPFYKFPTNVQILQVLELSFINCFPHIDFYFFEKTDYVIFESTNLSAMKRFFLLLSTIVFLTNAYSQDFFNTDFKKSKKYIILTNPTVNNLKTIQYLVNTHLLDIKKGKMKFVGVYFEGQNYDFSKTKNYIEENSLHDFHLQAIKGELNENNLFEENACTAQLLQIFENSIGTFFFGGPDIPPGVYSEENTLSVVTDPGRHYFETTFLFHLLGGYQNTDINPFLNDRPTYMVTGFCLGMQTMNVATGGTLIQDIPAEVYRTETPEATLQIGRANLHRNYWQEITEDTLLMGINLHTIKFTDNPFFGNVVKVSKRWEPRVYSSHHQAADKLGMGMEIIAVSPDGKIIEGLAHNRYPNVFAVQFHPEVPGLYEDLFERKFHPDDTPMSYNDIIGKQSVKFHQKYWAHISEVLRHVKKR